MKKQSFLVLGTRGSALALRQTELVAGLLRAANPEIQVRIDVLSTRGDRIQDRPISALGDKGVFVRPLQEALLAGAVDIAVHSLKDIPADVEVHGLTLAAFPLRADARDALVSPQYGSLDDLPDSARVGTGSLRRRALLRSLRPDLVVEPVRGNVDTRLRKLDAGEFDALVLAAAGLERLGLGGRIRQRFDPLSFVPDAGQGTIGVETRTEGPGLEAASGIDDRDLRRTALSERAVIRALGAGCQSPVGAYAVHDGVGVHLTAFAAETDGSHPIWESASGDGDGELLGRMLGERLRDAILEHD